jgi:hypothetical protein
MKYLNPNDKWLMILGENVKFWNKYVKKEASMRINVQTLHLRKLGK